MRIGNKTIGGVFSGLGVYLTVIAGLAIGGAGTTTNPTVSVLAGATAGILGFWYWMWGLRRAGMVSETNRWLKFSATPNHRKRKEGG